MKTYFKSVLAQEQKTRYKLYYIKLKNIKEFIYFYQVIYLLKKKFFSKKKIEKKIFLILTTNHEYYFVCFINFRNSNRKLPM